MSCPCPVGTTAQTTSTSDKHDVQHSVICTSTRKRHLTMAYFKVSLMIYCESSVRPQQGTKSLLPCSSVALQNEDEDLNTYARKTPRDDAHVLLSTGHLPADRTGLMADSASNNLILIAIGREADPASCHLRRVILVRGQATFCTEIRCC